MQPISLIRKLLPYTSVVLALALVNLAWTLISRWNGNRVREQAAEAQKARANERIVAMYGNGNLKILSFYTTSGTIRRGEKTLLCYGVANAAAVRIEPDVEPLKPSLSRCIEVAPAKNTQYMLTATDAAGHTETASIPIAVLR